MDDQTKNTAAFPTSAAVYTENRGMTLRDYFAAKALQPMVNEYDDFSLMAATAYEIADAMLAARSKT